jgi:hypothetical protein
MADSTLTLSRRLADSDGDETWQLKKGSLMPFPFPIAGGGVEFVPPSSSSLIYPTTCLRRIQFSTLAMMFIKLLQGASRNVPAAFFTCSECPPAFQLLRISIET